MRKRYPLLGVMVLFSCLVLLLGQAGAFSIRELLGWEEKQGEEEAVQNAKEGTMADSTESTDWAKPAGNGTPKQLQFSDVRLILANLDKNQRDNLLGDEEVFKQFIQNELSSLSVLAAAESNKLQSEANTVFLMQRSAQNVLREIYLRRLIAEKVPGDFPTEEQMKTYYEDNKSQFVIGERIHVWQIFLPLSKEMDDKQRTAVEQKANTIFRDIEAGKMSFPDAVLKYSENLPSRNNGGYMGLLQVETLLPEIRTSLAKLAEGKLSRPVKSDTGVHILKRGAGLPAQNFSYEQAKGEIRNLLITRVQAQLRKAIYEQAAKTYPVEVPDNRIEEWRLRLRTNLDGSQKKVDAVKAQ